MSNYGDDKRHAHLDLTIRKNRNADHDTATPKMDDRSNHETVKNRSLRKTGPFRLPFWIPLAGWLSSGRVYTLLYSPPTRFKLSFLSDGVIYYNLPTHILDFFWNAAFQIRLICPADKSESSQTANVAVRETIHITRQDMRTF